MQIPWTIDTFLRLCMEGASAVLYVCLLVQRNWRECVDGGGWSEAEFFYYCDALEEGRAAAPIVE